MYNFDKEDLKELSKRMNHPRDFDFNDYIPNSIKVRSNKLEDTNVQSIISTNAASNMERTNSETVGNRF